MTIAIPIGMNAPKTDKLYYYAVADKVLVGNKIQYLLFFDVDHKAFWPRREWPSYQLFDTSNGFHAIAKFLGDAGMKKYWFETWKKEWPDSDYQLNNISWL